MIGYLFSEEMLVLFAILALGGWLGSLSLRGITFGSAGVLFVALAFGHFGMGTPKPITELGLLLFVYAVGLQAGPSFFRLFRRQGWPSIGVALTVALSGAAAAWGLALWLDLPYDIASGMYTGALTCTPALAGAVDAAHKIEPARASLATVGYGLAYPLSMIGVVLLIQLLPRLLRRDLKAEEERAARDRGGEPPSLQVRQHRITNPNCDGKTLTQLQPQRFSLANLTRVRRGGAVELVSPEFVFRLGDVVMAVGAAEELKKLELLLGEETSVAMDLDPDIRTADTDVTEAAVVGKRLSELQLFQRYGVVVTRVRRQGAEFAPTGSVTLEMGDSIHLVGLKDAVGTVVRLIGGEPRRLQETSMVPFLLGLALGIALGMVVIPLPNGMHVKLGAAGGAFLVSLLAGHAGRIGKFRLFVPPAAKNLARELGLMLFLAGVGTTAGAQIVHILGQKGWALFLCGAGITAVSVTAGLVLMLKVFKWDLHTACGALSASMTNPPGLAAASGRTATNVPMLAYASVYPAALIFKILIAQILVNILWLR